MHGLRRNMNLVGYGRRWYGFRGYGGMGAGGYGCQGRGMGTGLKNSMGAGEGGGGE